ncbi:MAG TPA: carbon-nitrogen hydrolase family protein [Methylomirabilota bacterium]|nr:carbon-nitrogen hydrolase family protein [Methylomirabilota bacterium]
MPESRQPEDRVAEAPPSAGGTAHRLRLGLIQMRLEPGQKARNLRHACGLLESAAEGGAQVAVLPEAMPLGWTDPSARQHAEAIPEGETCRALAEVARRRHLWICSGLIERADGQLFNAGVLIDPTGRVVLHHRKIHELAIATDLYARGDRLGVADTPWGRVGVMICADAFIEGLVISRTLGAMGARLILSPCAWAVPAGHDNAREPYGQLWRDSYGPVARQFRLWIVGVSNVGPIAAGPWAGRRCIGCSLAVGPDGRPALQGPYGDAAESILYLDVTLPPASAPPPGGGGKRPGRL